MSKVKTFYDWRNETVVRQELQQVPRHCSRVEKQKNTPKHLAGIVVVVSFPPKDNLLRAAEKFLELALLRIVATGGGRL